MQQGMFWVSFRKRPKEFDFSEIQNQKFQCQEGCGRCCVHKGLIRVPYNFLTEQDKNKNR